MGMGGMPTPPFHHGGGMGDPGMPPYSGPGDYMSPHQLTSPPDMTSPGGGHPGPGSDMPPFGIGGGGPPMGGNNSGLPAHFLANDRPPDKGGGAAGMFYELGQGPQLHQQPLQDPDSLLSGEEPSDRNVPRPHPCEVCDKRFSQKCNLITHMRLHTGERPYVCPQCDKRFTQKGNLDAHLKTHSQTTSDPTSGGAKPFGCVNCGKKFASKSSLVSHARHAHADSPFEFDEISALKNQAMSKLTELPPSPSFSPGIPTPQSSLDSLSCYPNSATTPTGMTPPASGMHNGMAPDQPLMMGGMTVPGSDPLSDLTATVEAAPRLPPASNAAL